LCSSRKYPYSPHRRDWNFLGVGGKCMELNWNFQRGGKVLRKIPSVGEVWIFSGTTHCVLYKYTCTCNILYYMYHYCCSLGADVVIDAVRSSLQLLGNTVVQNDATQQFVWKKCFPRFFL